MTIQISDYRINGDSRFLTVKEAAQEIHVSPSTVRSLINKKQLRAYRFGRVIRVHEIDLREFMNRHISVSQWGLGQTKSRQ